MKKVSTITVLICLLIFHSKLSATTYTLAISNSAWNSPGTWVPQGIPGDGDYVIIEEKSVIIENSQHTIAGFTVIDGNINFRGTNPSLTITDSATWYDGEFDGGSGSNTINSNLIIDSGAILVLDSDATPETKRIYEGLIVINKGTIRLTGTANVGIRGGSLVRNEGLVDIASDADFHGESFSGGTFLNTSSGTLRKSGGTDITYFSTVWWIFINEGGKIEGLSGTLQLGEGTFDGGDYYASANGIVEFAGGTSVIKGTLTGSPEGIVRLGGARLNIDSSGAELDFKGAGFQWSSGTIYVYTTFTNREGSLLRLVTNPADLSYQYLRGGGTLVNRGTIRQESNDGLGLAGQQSSYLENFSLIEVITDAEFVGPSGSGTGTLINRGILRKSGGTGLTEIASRWYVQNEGGTIETRSGAMHFLGDGMINNGTFIASANTEIAYIGGPQVIKGTLSGSPAGKIVFADVTILVDTTGAALDFHGTGIQWSGGFIQGGNTLTNNEGSLLRLVTDTTNPGYQYLNNATTLVNLGTITQESNDGLGFAIVGSSVLENHSLFDITTDAEFPGPSGRGTGTFINNGTLRKSGGNNVSLLHSRLTFINENNGFIEANSGTIDIDDFTTTENSVISGTDTINIPGTINNGIVSPGNSAGTLKYIGNYNPSATGVLDIELGGLIAGSEHDQLIITGNASLDGTLRITLIEEFIPSEGDSFVVLTTTGSVTDNFISLDVQSGLYLTVKRNSNNVTIVVDSVGTITSVYEEADGEKILKYELSQNYPNPFNPSTRIQFAIRHATFVTLEIFNAIGERMDVLLSEQLAAGSYNYEWNASNFPSGIYFYRIAAGEFNETKKMLLIR